jgi:ElaB/YqjD/DUF883 family membrane-anchored ribosome-binding protein
MDDTSGRVDRDPRDVVGRSAEATRGYAADERDVSEDQRTREIRDEIEETRGEMSETIDAIQEKLNPRNIMANATDRVKSAATERVRDMAETASHTAKKAMDYTNPIPLALIGVGAAWLLSSQSRERNDYSQLRDDWDGWDDRDRDTGFMARIRNNPIPAALAGVGLGWLAFSGSEREGEEWRARNPQRWRTAGTGRWESGEGERWNRAADEAGGTGSRVADSASEMASRTKEYASDTADSMRRMARRRQNQVQRMVQESPLLVGAGALMLGAAFGLAIPETDVENEWMGEARDNVVGQAREMARDTVNEVQEAAGTVADAAKKLTGKPQS